MSQETPGRNLCPEEKITQEEAAFKFPTRSANLLPPRGSQSLLVIQQQATIKFPNPETLIQRKESQAVKQYPQASRNRQTLRNHNWV